MGAGEMAAQELRALAVHAVGPGLVPHMHMVVNNHLQLQFQRI